MPSAPDLVLGSAAPSIEQEGGGKYSTVTRLQGAGYTQAQRHMSPCSSLDRCMFKSPGYMALCHLVVEAAPRQAVALLDQGPRHGAVEL